MEWLRATYPLTIIHFGNVLVRVILTPRELFFVCVCVCLPQRHDLDAVDWIHAHWIGVRGPPQIGSMERRHALHFHRTLDDH